MGKNKTKGGEGPSSPAAAKGGAGGGSAQGGAKHGGGKATSTTTTTAASKKNKLQRGGSGGAETATVGQKEKVERKATPASRAGEMGRFWAASTLLQESLACNYTAGAEM